ncbi:MAG: DUF3606 domain-containing protein [Pseudomonadota bacterium]
MIQLVTVASVLARVEPAQSIRVDDAAAVDQWAQRLDVSRNELLAAISEVGHSIAAVRRHLGAN